MTFWLKNEAKMTFKRRSRHFAGFFYYNLQGIQQENHLKSYCFKEVVVARFVWL